MSILYRHERGISIGVLSRVMIIRVCVWKGGMLIGGVSVLISGCVQDIKGACS